MKCQNQLKFVFMEDKGLLMATSLQCNVVSHWLGAFTKWSLIHVQDLHCENNAGVRDMLPIGHCCNYYHGTLLPISRSVRKTLFKNNIWCPKSSRLISKPRVSTKRSFQGAKGGLLNTRSINEKESSICELITDNQLDFLALKLGALINLQLVWALYNLQDIR